MNISIVGNKYLAKYSYKFRHFPESGDLKIAYDGYEIESITVDSSNLKSLPIHQPISISPDDEDDFELFKTLMEYLSPFRLVLDMNRGNVLSDSKMIDLIPFDLAGLITSFHCTPQLPTLYEKIEVEDFYIVMRTFPCHIPPDPAGPFLKLLKRAKNVDLGNAPEMVEFCEAVEELKILHLEDFDYPDLKKLVVEKIGISYHNLTDLNDSQVKEIDVDLMTTDEFDFFYEKKGTKTFNIRDSNPALIAHLQGPRASDPELIVKMRGVYILGKEKATLSSIL
jgi:hypothetical protein